LFSQRGPDRPKTAGTGGRSRELSARCSSPRSRRRHTGDGGRIAAVERRGSIAPGVVCLGVLEPDSAEAGGLAGGTSSPHSAPGWPLPLGFRAATAVPAEPTMSRTATAPPIRALLLTILPSGARGSRIPKVYRWRVGMDHRIARSLQKIDIPSNRGCLVPPLRSLLTSMVTPVQVRARALLLKRAGQWESGRRADERTS
jgi:hypothetical protein